MGHDNADISTTAREQQSKYKSLEEESESIRPTHGSRRRSTRDKDKIVLNADVYFNADAYFADVNDKINLGNKQTESTIDTLNAPDDNPKRKRWINQR
jgi:hypothetical protein